MDITGDNVYKEAQKMFPNSHSIPLLNRGSEKTNDTPSIYTTPEDRETRENTHIGEVIKLMSAYQSLEEDVSRLENAVSGSEKSQ